MVQVLAVIVTGCVDACHRSCCLQQCAAWARASSVIAAPDSIRAISSRRSLGDQLAHRGARALAVMRFLDPIMMRRARRDLRAVGHDQQLRHCSPAAPAARRSRWPPRRRRRGRSRRRSSSRAPPASASATLSARMKRDNSPPDAILVSGPNGAPGLVDTSNSTRSVPDGPASASRDRGAEPRGIELERRQLAGHRCVEPRRRRRCALAVSALAAARISARAPRPARAPARRSVRRHASIAASRACIVAPSAGQRVGLDAMLARQRRECRTAAPRPPRAGPDRMRQRLGGAGDLVLGLAGLDQRPVERGQRLGQQRMVGGDPLDPPRRLAASCASAAVGPAEQVVEPASASRSALRRRLHRRPRLGQLRSSSPGSGASAAISPTAMVEPVAVALGRRRAPARCLGQFGLQPRRPRPRAARPRAVSIRPNASSKARWPRGLSRPRSSCWPWISTSPCGDVAQQSMRAPPAPPAKARLPPSALSVRRSSSGSPGSRAMPCSASSGEGGMVGAAARISALTLACALPRADQPGVGAIAERQPERVEQDRLARAGLAGQHAKAGLELELEPVDQHDVADGELPQHRRPVAAGSALRRRRRRRVPLDQLDSCAGTIRCPDNWRRAPRRPSAPPRACRARDRIRPAAPALPACGWWSDTCRSPCGSGSSPRANCPGRW